MTWRATNTCRSGGRHVCPTGSLAPRERSNRVDDDTIDVTQHNGRVDNHLRRMPVEREHRVTADRFERPFRTTGHERDRSTHRQIDVETVNDNRRRRRLTIDHNPTDRHDNRSAEPFACRIAHERHQQHVAADEHTFVRRRTLTNSNGKLGVLDPRQHLNGRVRAEKISNNSTRFGQLAEHQIDHRCLIFRKRRQRHLNSRRRQRTVVSV